MRISQKLSHSLIPFMISWARFWLWLSGYNMQNIQLTFLVIKNVEFYAPGTLRVTISRGLSLYSLQIEI